MKLGPPDDAFGCYNAGMKKPSVTFWGAAREVTGSMHMVESNGFRLLLDCGLYMGKSRYAQNRNRLFPFPPESIDAVVVSHAHIDHCGNLPNLVRQGFEGPIYCTPATKDLMAVMLADSARIQKEEAENGDDVGVDESSTGLLYTGVEVEETLRRCETIPYGESRSLHSGMVVRLIDAGHLLGSAMIHLQIDTPAGTKRVTYTGDMGRSDLKFLKPPSDLPAADVILCESTYGGRTHAPVEEIAEKLRRVVKTTAEREGKVLIPAFSLGRAQIVVNFIRQWMHEGLLPRLPLYVDSPLASSIAAIYDLHPNLLDPSAINGASHDVPLQYVRRREESTALSKSRGPSVLVASGGMCEAGRILNHLENNIDDPRNSVVLVSYQAPGSLGQKLMERGPTVRFRGRKWNKWADVFDVSGFSGHADREELLRQLRPHAEHQPRIALVHGDIEQSTLLSESLMDEGFREVDVPARETTIHLA
jgi:metallo-beta-lactamase family protein